MRRGFFSKAGLLLFLLVFLSVFISGCSVFEEDGLLYVLFSGKDTVFKDEKIEVDSVVGGLPNFFVFEDEVLEFNPSHYISGCSDFKLKRSEGFSYKNVNDLLVVKPLRTGSWETVLFCADKSIGSVPFFIVIVDKDDDSIKTINGGKESEEEKEDGSLLGEIDSQTTIFEEIKEISGGRTRMDESISESIDNESVDPSQELVFTHEDSKCPRYSRDITREELDFLLEVQVHNTSQKILGFINEEFEVINRDEVMGSVLETYNSRSGTKYDLLRLLHYVLSENCFQRSYVVYEYEENGENKLDAVINFRDTDKPRYFYYDGEWGLDHHGWSFNDLMNAEEERRNIYIHKYGVIFERDVFTHDDFPVRNVSEWVTR